MSLALELALDQTIGFSDTDDFATSTPGVATVRKPVFRVPKPSQHIRFLDDLRDCYTTLPDLKTLYAHAKRFLAKDEPSLTGTGLDLKARSLSTYGHSFGRTYQGFTHDEAPF